MKKLKILGVCNGQGIGLFPFLNDPNYEVLGNIEPRREYFSPKNEQWKANFPKKPLWRDFYSMCDSEKRYLRESKVSIIIGNPKCGGSSILRLSRAKEFKKKEEIKTEITLQTFIDAVHEFKPKMFLLENLPKLLEHIDEIQFQTEIFPDYDLVFHTRSVEGWGNSQISRIRLVIIGVKKSYRRLSIRNFLKVYPVGKIKFTRELLKDLEMNVSGNIREAKNKTLSMYDYRDPSKRKLTVEEIRKLWKYDFKNEFKWPIKTQKMNTLPGVYRNRNEGYPMTARKADRQFTENGLPMSPRELARIMGIPDNFEIYVNDENPQYWINKGRLIVTQTFPYEVGVWFKQCIELGLKI